MKEETAFQHHLNPNLNRNRNQVRKKVKIKAEVKAIIRIKMGKTAQVEEKAKERAKERAQRITKRVSINIQSKEAAASIKKEMRAKKRNNLLIKIIKNKKEEVNQNLKANRKRDIQEIQKIKAGTVKENFQSLNINNKNKTTT